ncbi:nuclear transport factor 2 family protein [Mycolicibacterium mucogenicum]|uniref:nuclear transport factor 2 family protein n=1 Tax=Mycolicibacterium mucogenicum TaxID=56689 RepID=UPI00226A0AE5|nr:nuclear transport factor 2 family protein [Mycolicibacterium mucogenicum]MCX8562753.1 nuclear transport factor 2 family protein [Mycolicibacterium mucogenicum]
MTTSTDSVATFCAATRSGDVDRFIAALAPEAELISPLSGRMVFRGHDDIRVLLTAVYAGMRNLEWENVIGDGPMRVAVSRGRVAGLTITDALVFELDDAGLIRRLRPHLRPWLAVTVFALLLGPKLAAHPGVARRALSR